MTGGCLEFISQSGNRLPPYCPKAEAEATATHSEYPAAPKALEMRHRRDSIFTADVMYRTSCGGGMLLDACCAGGMFDPALRNIACSACSYALAPVALCKTV